MVKKKAAKKRVSKKLIGKGEAWAKQFEPNVLRDTLEKQIVKEATRVSDLLRGTSTAKSDCQTLYLQGPKHPAPKYVEEKKTDFVSWNDGYAYAKEYLFNVSLWQYFKERWNYSRRAK